MNSNEIFGHIEAIAATASKNEKLALVAQHADDDDFKRVLVAALAPLISYGLVKLPERTSHGAGYFDEGGNTWALLDSLATRKLTGNAARDAVQNEINRLEEPSSQLFRRIIRKDLRAGFSESTVNKVIKGLIQEYPYMRCCLPKDAKLDLWDWVGGVPSQEKADSMFANVDHEEGGLVRITSRQGSPFPEEPFAKLISEAQARLLCGTQSHGEMLVKRAGKILPREIANGILNSVLKGGSFGHDEAPVYKVWDQIPLSAVVAKGKHSVPYKERVRGIVAQLESGPGDAIEFIETRICHSIEEAYAHFREMLLKGKEGTVIKNPDGIWRDTGSSGSKDQVKLKLEADVELRVTGVVPGKDGGKNDGRPGSVGVETSCGQLKTDVAIKNEKMRDEIEANPEDFIGRVIVVRFNFIMRPSPSNEFHSLFLPRMVESGYRIDKTEPDSLQRVFDQFDAAIQGKKLAEEPRCEASAPSFS